MERWYRFSAYNTQAMYGFGTASEADRYVDHLNANRTINVYSAKELSAEEAAELTLEDNTEAFNIDDALASER